MTTNLQQFIEDDQVLVRTVDRPTGVDYVLAFPRSDRETTVDIVDGTAIVVTGHGDTERQHEIDLPQDDAEAFIKNGILTIHMEDAE